jgi:predicted  nucleic acid-binding Zn-ribbon protein
MRNPCLAFEDMIFLLMRALVKQSQLEVKIGLQTEKTNRDQARVAERAERGALQADEAALSRQRAQMSAMQDGPEKNQAAADLGTRQTALNARREQFTSDLGEATESRQERFEELKQAMQKITEMQQALSNILNTLHQTAMSTIGNIR